MIIVVSFPFEYQQRLKRQQTTRPIHRISVLEIGNRNPSLKVDKSVVCIEREKIVEKK